MAEKKPLKLIHLLNYYNTCTKLKLFKVAEKWIHQFRLTLLNEHEGPSGHHLLERKTHSNVQTNKKYKLVKKTDTRLKSKRVKKGLLLVKFTNPEERVQRAVLHVLCDDHHWLAWRNKQNSETDVFSFSFWPHFNICGLSQQVALKLIQTFKTDNTQCFGLWPLN